MVSPSKPNRKETNFEPFQPAEEKGAPQERPLSHLVNPPSTHEPARINQAASEPKGASKATDRAAKRIFRGRAKKESAQERIDRVVADHLYPIKDALIKLLKAPIQEKDAEEFEKLCKEFESIGGAAIKEVLKELKRISTLQGKLELHAIGNQEKKRVLAEQYPLLDISLMNGYKLFADIRKLLAANIENVHGPARHNLLKAHHHLSNAMGQTSDHLTDSIVLPSSKASMRTAMAIAITNQQARAHLNEAIHAFAQGLSKAVQNAFKRHLFRKPQIETFSKTMNKTKVVMVNCMAALLVSFSAPLFGKDLKATSRNVVKQSDTVSSKDLILAKVLQKKIEASKPQGGLQLELPNMTQAHITDGVCAGFSLELSLQVERGGGDYMQYAGNLAKGAPPEAHAHQAAYEAAPTKSLRSELLVNMMEQQQQFALDPEKGKGVFKANYQNVKSCYDAILNSTELDRNASDLADAVTQCKDLLKPPQGQEIPDLATFKQAVSIYLARKNPPLERERRELAQNELEWLISNLELRYQFEELVKHQKPVSFEDFFNIVSNKDIQKMLLYMAKVEIDFDGYQMVAQARGAELQRMEGVLGFSFGMKNDSEVLDRMDQLEDGCYVLSIDLVQSGHAMQFYKQGQRQYLFDPNFGVIDCSDGRHKEQITKLLTSLEFMYPPTDRQGLYSDGTSHNISLVKVIAPKESVEKDVLKGVKAADYELDAQGQLKRKSAGKKAMELLAPPSLTQDLRNKILKHLLEDETKVKAFLDQLKSYAEHKDQDKVLMALEATPKSSLGKAVLKALKKMEKKRQSH